MAKLKTGLIGCGQIAQLVHIPILMQLPDVELVALAESNAERRQEASERAKGARAFSSYQELLGAPDVEAVIICLPNALHAEVAIAALDAGKHIYLEKPLATSLEEGRAVLSAWRRASVVGMMGFNYRFNKLYEAMRCRIQEGALGDLVAVRSVFSFSSPNLPEWKLERRNGGGALLDLASHHVDLIRYFFDQDVAEVFAEIRSQRSEGDSATLQLRLADGLLTQSFFSMHAVEEDRFEVYGQRGRLSVDRHLSTDVRHSEPTLRGVRLKQLRDGVQSLAHSSYVLEKMRAPAFEPSYRTAVAQFVSAAKSGANVKPDLIDGLESLAVIEAAEESARTRRAVSLIGNLS